MNPFPSTLKKSNNKIKPYGNEASDNHSAKTHQIGSNYNYCLVTSIYSVLKKDENYYLEVV